MAISVFVSSTSQDLKEDCRPAAIQAIGANNAIPIAMETWDAPFENVVVVCKRMLEKESSHYLGIFAYRQGMVLPELGKSITQVEFEWACSLMQPSCMAVFMPNLEKDFGKELFQRAVVHQTPEETAAQQAFLTAVQGSGKSCATFDNLVSLAIKITRRVSEWSKGGIFDEAARAETDAAFINLRLPSDKDLTTLGRSIQSRKFSDAFDLIKDQEQPDVVGFLIHGPSDYGQQQALDRLRFKYENDFNSEPHRLIVPIGAQLYGRNLKKLLENIGNRIAPGYMPESVAALAVRLQALLQTKDILLEIPNLQRFEGGLPEFANQFWNPIASRLRAEPPLKQLVAFITMEQAATGELDGFLFNPTTDQPEDFNAAKIIKLPELTAFTQKEIAVWVLDWLKQDPARAVDPQQLAEDAQNLAKTLFQETGGKPVTIYNKLKSHATWC